MPKTRWIWWLIQFLGILTDYFYHYHNRIPIRAFVSHLPIFKVGVMSKLKLLLIHLEYYSYYGDDKIRKVQELIYFVFTSVNWNGARS